MTILMIILAIIGGAMLISRPPSMARVGQPSWRVQERLPDVFRRGVDHWLADFLLRIAPQRQPADAEMATIGGDVRRAVHCHHGARRAAYWYCGRHRRRYFRAIDHEYADR